MFIKYLVSILFVQLLVIFIFAFGRQKECILTQFTMCAPWIKPMTFGTAFAMFCQSYKNQQYNCES